MTYWGSSAGTLLFLPDPACALDVEDLAILAAGNVQVVANDDYWHNPMAWFDSRGDGLFLRLSRVPPHYGDGIRWGDREQEDAVLHVAERATLRSRRRWYALCEYGGWDEECRDMCEHPTFEDFRDELRRLEEQRLHAKPRHQTWGPPDCVIHKVHGPPWMPDMPSSS
ncbi:MAG TPA: hypothetical protein VM938_10300 [Acidimicrobiales bacterium]|nr:hypothetical protein [Acidimicrobiales bacterium]